MSRAKLLNVGVLFVLIVRRIRKMLNWIKNVGFVKKSELNNDENEQVSDLYSFFVSTLELSPQNLPSFCQIIFVNYNIKQILIVMKSSSISSHLLS